jgi:hypothetical protein
LIGAVTVVIGLVMFVAVLSDYASGDPEPAESVAFLADNHATIFIWNLITLIVFSVALVVVALALNRRLKAGPSLLAQTATAFGIIWAGLLIAAGMIANIGFGTVVDLYATNATQAETVWLAVDSVGNGLSGGMEIVGPMWVLLASVAALQTGALPKALNYVGILIAAAGFVTIIPALEAVGAVFGLGLIVWLTWLGIVMLRTDPTEAT